MRIEKKVDRWALCIGTKTVKTLLWFIRGVLCLVIALSVVMQLNYSLTSLPSSQDQDGVFHDGSNSNSKKKFASSVTECPTISTGILQPNLKSQSNEDIHLLQWFNGLCNGTYIEMGGLDGIMYSNTYVFNKAFQWRGLLVELSPKNYQALVQNRPNEVATVNAAVCGERQMIHYYESANGAVSGVWEFAAESFRQQWWKGVTIDKTTPIECSPLRDILEEHVPEQHYFDIFSLDIEGGEFMALQSLDFDRVGFGMIIVEADEHNPRKNMAIRAFMESKGYIFLEEFERSNWFVNKEFGRIYKDVLH